MPGIEADHESVGGKLVLRYITDLALARSDRDSVVTLGKFDGFHRGHQQLFGRLYRMKQEHGWVTAAFTFDAELMYYKFGKQIRCILEKDERRRLFERLDVDMMIECPFTDEVRTMEAERFIKDILVDQLKARCIVVGRDFRFGHNRRGSYEMLADMAPEYGYEVQMIDEVYDGDVRISSSKIREALREGRVEDANRMLGYYFTVEGTILNGEHLGRTIDMPTINLVPSPIKLLPPYGVYVSIVEIEDKTYAGVTNIGRKPTVGEFAVGVETHLLHTQGNFYGKFAKVHLLHFARLEQKFPSIEVLKEQVHRDKENAENWLKAHPKITEPEELDFGSFVEK